VAPKIIRFWINALHLYTFGIIIMSVKPNSVAFFSKRFFILFLDYVLIRFLNSAFHSSCLFTSVSGAIIVIAIAAVDIIVLSCFVSLLSSISHIVFSYLAI